MIAFWAFFILCVIRVCKENNRFGKLNQIFVTQSLTGEWLHVDLNRGNDSKTPEEKTLQKHCIVIMVYAS